MFAKLLIVFKLKNMKKFLFCLMTLIFISSCAKVPLTGRKQILLFSDKEILALSLQNYNEYLKETPLSKDIANSNKIKTIGKNISAAVETYLKQNGLTAEVKNYAWDFQLVEEKSINAFCLPGGKVVFYEGILPITKNDNGIAVVMGHEIAHAVAKHSNERMSQQAMIEYGSAASGVLLNGKSEESKQIWNTAIGLGANIGVLLPYSRKHEYEADRLGLIFMAMAGYNPNEAVDFWSRMEKLSGGNSTPEFLSTHPSSKKRIEEMKKNLPEALRYYKKK